MVGCTQAAIARSMDGHCCLWETLRMARRALRLVKHLGRTPAVAVCTVCGKTFEVPLGALMSVKDAEGSLVGQAAVGRIGLLVRRRFYDSYGRRIVK
jgi:hypothetical protein